MNQERHAEAIADQAQEALEATARADLIGDELISGYSRAQAIEDGVLVDLCKDHGQEIKEAGFVVPFACTVAVHASCIALTPAAERAGNDIAGRLWDILRMARLEIARSPRGRTGDLLFEVLIVRDRVRATLTKLKLCIGPGDSMEPVLTLMFPEED